MFGGRFADRQWSGRGGLQEPHQGPDGAIWDALDRSHGRSHREAQSHLPERGSRPILGLPRSAGAESTLFGWQMERRRKVVTPFRNKYKATKKRRPEVFAGRAK